jgi:energy-converting hydrogenase Eha subunit A
MPDFLKSLFVDGPSIALLDVLVRLLVAMALGIAVAWIYRATRKSAEMSASFSVTLVLLAILIAVVTQVIGDNIARAFSLVGALSIVRFRTVVRDTQDTAYVIFAFPRLRVDVLGHFPTRRLPGCRIRSASAPDRFRGRTRKNIEPD